MKRLFLILLNLIPLGLCAQEGWVRTYGGEQHDGGIFIQQTEDGGYVIIGNTESFGEGENDLWLLKIDSEGDTLWTRTIGGQAWEWVWGSGSVVRPTEDGGYIIVGETSSFGAGSSDVWLIKTNTVGEILWSRTYGRKDADRGYCVLQSIDGGYIVLGVKDRVQLWLIKVNEQGDTLWTRTYGEDHGCDIQRTSDGGYIITGRTRRYDEDGDLLLLKINSNGDTLWSRAYGGDDVDRGQVVLETNGGGYAILGSTQGDLWLLKTDAQGDSLWSQFYGSEYDDRPFCVQQTREGGYIILGLMTLWNQRWYDICVIKTDSNGDTLWTRNYGGDNYDLGCWMQQTKDGGYIITGRTPTIGEGECDLVIIKTDSLGNVSLEVSPTKIFHPIDGCEADSIVPEAKFSNFGTYYASLYCHCEIVGVDYHNSDRHDSLSVGLNSWESRAIKFPKWGAKDISNYDATFYVTLASGEPLRSRPMSVGFRWNPLDIEEQPVSEPGFEVINAFGRQIVLRYTDSPKGFHASIFDASGRKVDEVHSNLKSGTIEWGEGFNSGVYFVRVEDGSPSSVQKVVLIR